MARKINTNINGKDYYRVRRTIGHTANGKEIIKSFYGTGEKDANEKAEKYINDLKLGLVDNGKFITINTLFPKWLLEVKKNEVKPTTFEKYEGLYRNYISKNIIADIPISEVKSLPIQKFYNDLSVKKNKNDTLIRSIHKLLRSFFDYVEKEGYIIKNPCNTISLPKTKKTVDEIIAEKTTKFQYFTEEEIPELIQLFEGYNIQPIIRFALGTGMRKGEIFGLQWDDINFDNREISVKHNLSFTSEINEIGKKTYKTILQTPKTQNSIRIIPMSEKIYQLLKSLPQNSDYVFSSSKTHTHFDIKWAEKVWAKKTKGTKFENKRFHDLRHTFATMLLLKGANLIQIKELLGHSSVKITEIYLDALPKTKEEIINKIDDLI